MSLDLDHLTQVLWGTQLHESHLSEGPGPELGCGPKKWRNDDENRLSWCSRLFLAWLVYKTLSLPPLVPPLTFSAPRCIPLANWLDKISKLHFYVCVWVFRSKLWMMNVCKNVRLCFTWKYAADPFVLHKHSQSTSDRAEGHGCKTEKRKKNLAPPCLHTHHSSAPPPILSIHSSTYPLPLTYSSQQKARAVLKLSRPVFNSFLPIITSAGSPGQAPRPASPLWETLH